jgi:phage tail-like protein
MAHSGSRNDPYASFNFVVEIDGVAVGGFLECTGLSVETDPIEYRTGADDTTFRKLPGLRKYSNIVLKRGLTSSRELWEWYKAVIDGRTQRRSGSITLLNEQREPVLVWRFQEGWPRKLEGPTLNAKNNEVAIESLEICHEGLELA